MKISSFALTDVGKMRLENQDAFFIDDKLHLYAVADGLGGLPEGALASSLAVQHLQENFGNHSGNGIPDYKKLFYFINKKITDKGRKISEETGIGTTLTVVKLNGEEMAIGHVGDSSVFLFRADDCKQLTTDHTMEQEALKTLGPDEIASLPSYFAHTLTQCMGQKDNPIPEILNYNLETGDRILICSDGISKILVCDDLLQELKNTASPKDFMHGIVQLANARGGPDNATGIAIFID